MALASKQVSFDLLDINYFYDVFEDRIHQDFVLPLLFFSYYRRRNDDLLVSLGVGGKMTTYGGEMNVDY